MLKSPILWLLGASRCAGAYAYAGFSITGKRADGSGGERELGLVTTIAYAGFLADPPIMGGLAHVSSLVVSLGFVALVTALIIPATWLAGKAARQSASV